MYRHSDPTIHQYYTLRFYFPYLSLLAQPVNIIYLLTGYEGIASLLSPRLTIDRGEAKVNSQGRGDNKLVIPEYTVYKYFTIPKHIKLIVEWSPQNDKDQ
jgi:hypothetical protein